MFMLHTRKSVVSTRTCYSKCIGVRIQQAADNTRQQKRRSAKSEAEAERQNVLQEETVSIRENGKSKNCQFYYL